MSEASVNPNAKLHGWADFMRERSVGVCHCDDPDCGASVTECPACGGPVSVTIVSARPEVHLECWRCGAIIARLRLERGQEQ